ncbi:MAG: glutathione peroxidase [Saprospiraceae bacterium]|nr:glutathione peroxidase [Saprospiraceae bacterium]
MILYSLILMLIAMQSSIYDFQMKAIDGEIINFDQYRDKPLLIVNTASKCGYTPQYADLQEMHEKYGADLVILGFPANNFGGQEPGSNTEIAQFCEKNFGVSFQMFEKISVKGSDQHPLYQWLKSRTGKEPTWNFCKYLVLPDGTVHFYDSGVKPMDDEITKLL